MLQEIIKLAVEFTVKNTKEKGLQEGQPGFALLACS